MSTVALQDPKFELDAINVIQGGWAVESRRVLRTILGSCVAVCLFDPVRGIGGMNHYVFPPRDTGHTRFSATSMAADLCMEGLFDALLAAGAQREYLRAKAFGGATMFAGTADPLAVGKRNASFAKQWLHEVGIPLDLSDFHGNCARKLLFHPASGQHLCRRLAADFPLPTVRPV